jgi:hypothetical protein
MLKRWASSASGTALTLDFGDYEQSYTILKTPHAEAISALIAGYIDIILKARREASRLIEQEKGLIASEEDVARNKGIANPQFAMYGNNPYGGANSPAQRPKTAVTDLKSAIVSMGELVEDLRNTPDKPMFSNLSKEQWDNQLTIEMGNLDNYAQAMLEIIKDPNGITRIGLEDVAKKIAIQVDQMAVAAKNAALCGKTTKPGLILAAKAISESLRNTLRSAEAVVVDPRAIPLYAETLGLAPDLYMAAAAFMQFARQVRMYQISFNFILGKCK